MDDVLLNERQARRFAQFLTACKRHVVPAIGEFGVSQRAVSLNDRAFATKFVEALADELREGDRSPLDGFARELGCDVLNAEAHARRLCVACAAVVQLYAAEAGRCDDVVRYLAIRASELERLLLDVQARMAREWTPDPAVRVAQSDLVVTLLAPLESHDEGTLVHAKAVGAWCGQLGRLLGMTTVMQEVVSTCGALHDIGKLTIQRELLVKPSELEEDEWEKMRAHAGAGAEILERIPALREFAPVIRAHHERIDGRGYPDGLCGDGIPFAARIIAVADAFHVMITPRPYRKAMPIAQALEILRQGRGTQWDAGVVDAMIAYIVPKPRSAATRLSATGSTASPNSPSYW